MCGVTMDLPGTHRVVDEYRCCHALSTGAGMPAGTGCSGKPNTWRSYSTALGRPMEADQVPMMCADLCAVCPGPIGPWRGESPGRGGWDDSDERVRTRCRHLLSGGSQVRTLPGAPPEQVFCVRRESSRPEMCARKSAVVNAYELVRTPTGVWVPELTANIQDHGFLRWWLDRVSGRTASSLSLRNFR